MLNQIYIITVIIFMSIVLLSNLVTYFIKRKAIKNISKNHYLVGKGIDELSRNIAIFQFEKRRKQLQQIKEDSDILYQKYHDIFCNNMKVDHHDIRAKAYKHSVLDRLRLLTDKILIKACEDNHFTEKQGSDWSLYKKGKAEYILTCTIERTEEIFDENLIQFTHKEVILKCREQIKTTYFEKIFDIFDALKNIAFDYEEKIEKKEEILEEMKNSIINGYKSEYIQENHININLPKV